MSLWRQLSRGLRAVAGRAAGDRDEADEVEHYLEQATAAHLAAGLPEAEARRAARIELGGVTGVREQVRGYGWENVVEALAADLRYAARRLRSEPAFTLIAVLTLAIGIGATTAIVSAVNPILLQSLPYPEAGRIVTIWDIGQDGDRLDVAFGTTTELAARSRSFETIAAMKSWRPTLQGAAEPERLEGQRVGAGYFRVLGVPPALGQDLAPAEDRPGGANVVVLSDGLWRRRFGGDTSIIGRPITLDGDLFVVAGVMPPGFENVPWPSAELWTALQYDMTEGRAWGHHLRAIGRLRPGVDPEQARLELDGIARSPIAEFPRVAWATLQNGLLVRSLQDDVTRAVKPALLAILGAAALVLAIACLNVTNLLLARGTRRRAEFALRAALGAGQGRLTRQLLTESLLLALLGGAAGMAVAVLGARTLVALSPPDLPRVGAIGVDGSVFAFGLGITALIGLAVGLIPALHATRGDPQGDISRGSPRTAGGRWRARSALVVTEVALALVLLVGSGLLLRSLERLFAVEAGFDETGVLTMQIQTSGPRLDDDGVRHRFFAEALDLVRQVPGVTEAALTSQLPLSGDLDLYGVHFDPAPPDDPGEVRGTFRYAVSPDYIETMGIPVLRGRGLERYDGPEAQLVALVSESMVKRRLGGRDPIGQRIRIGEEGPYTIVGVVGDVRQVSLALSETDAVYTTTTQWSQADPAMSLVVRSRADAAALAPAIRRAIWSADKDQAIVRIATMEDLLAASAAERRFALLLFEAFAVSALVLAAAGIYGVLAGNVAERTREIGVRAALGASRESILALVIRRGMVLTGLGVAVGLAGSAATTQAIVAMLFGVSPLDPVTYLVVVALLAGVSIVASGLPAWRAARVDPVSALRAE